MLNSISERRIRLKNKYKLFLEIPEDEFLLVYDNNVNEENAKDVLKQYLNYHQDDGRVDSVEIKHDKNNHMISIEADLYYLGNDHTTQDPIPPYLNQK